MVLEFIEDKKEFMLNSIFNYPLKLEKLKKERLKEWEDKMNLMEKNHIKKYGKKIF